MAAVRGTPAEKAATARRRCPAPTAPRPWAASSRPQPVYWPQVLTPRSRAGSASPWTSRTAGGGDPGALPAGRYRSMASSRPSAGGESRPGPASGRGGDGRAASPGRSGAWRRSYRSGRQGRPIDGAGAADQIWRARTPRSVEVEMAEPRTAAVMEALASVYDPCCQEKGLSVVDMGLVRKVDLDGDQARVELLLTTGWCPFAANLVGQITERVAALPGMAGSTVEIVWDEPLTTDRLSDKARRTLRFLPHPKEVGE